ncbi:phospho-sugar mutase [Weissella paramesenteroides]|uniref:phospho-sugar mutase n=1 Tax=Weissella paramesenteroides TaxID=1249 RepID=UPI0020738175|nr:phospho-sugar mutase [Weissella paramesenteroides]MCM6765287.1 phospho-sugar mutase [Weissella paramesenteroides]MCM6766658.1 phospho-sugar mutase [Weissella paramesenteroides]MCM6769080.1 phospho-sugar mutase [Weissella paramesenteroides]MCM6771578.1 phospho-sugar mutase [Weissella paramesenteroides]MCM6779329.1 phospho-sugar mutase [Weissella paramesenteroides]
MTWQDNFQVWTKRNDLPEYLKNEMDALAKDDQQAEDAFYQPLSFGTAGMRGLLGAGINRMNIYTVRQATEGLARLMDSLSEDVKARGVAISYDSRHFSQEFAFESAKVLGAHGIKAYVFESLRPTPELSFTVRYFKAYAGIMITASHNPKEYNGYKIYGEDGGQMPPKESDIITASIREADMFAVPVKSQAELEAAGLLVTIGKDVDDAYLSEIKTVTVDQELVNKEGRDMKLVYSPLHGTGALIAGQALNNAGFKNVTIVPEQEQPDGDFPTVTLPNPEDPAALAMGIALAKKQGADVVIGVDPDADRMGTAVRLPSGEYQLLTGNQIGAILLHYLLTAKKAAGTLPANGVLVKSIVSSEFAADIAKSFNIETINVLTGFKYIAEQIQNYESTHEHTFLFGFEESYGYLVKSFARDKDSIQATVLLAEVAAYYKSLGKTLYDGLQDLFAEYGYFVENTQSLTFKGIDGEKKIAALMAKFRAEQPTSFGNIAVTKYADFTLQTETDVQTGVESTMSLPKANVLKYWLADGSWVAVRPSGTEPKIKLYVGTNGTTQQIADDKLAAIQQSIADYVD